MSSPIPSSQGVDRVLGRGRLLEPARRLVLLGERLEGAHRGDPGQRQRLWAAPARPRGRAPAPAAGGGAPVVAITSTLWLDRLLLPGPPLARLAPSSSARAR